MTDDTKLFTSEKNLYSIFKQCKRLRKNWLNEIVTALSLLCLTAFYISADCNCVELSRTLGDWSEISISYAGTILGFIIAGYTILLTFAPSDLLIKSAYIIESHSKLPYLKVFQFTFIEVFIYFATTIFIAIMIKAFFLYEGPVYTLFEHTIYDYNKAYSFTCKTLIVTIISLTIYITMKLKSFIFNIYTISMSVLRFKKESSDNDTNQPSPRQP